MRPIKKREKIGNAALDFAQWIARKVAEGGLSAIGSAAGGAAAAWVLRWLAGP